MLKETSSYYQPSFLISYRYTAVLHEDDEEEEQWQQKGEK